MRGIMNERIIKGPFLVLLFLIISFGANWRHQCEAGTLITAIADSGSVSNERNNMTNNNPISISPPENKTTLVLPVVSHANVVQLQPEERVVVKDIIVVEEDNISIAQRSVPPQEEQEPEPCPIENHSERMEDSEIDKQKEEGGGSNLQNGNDKSSNSSGPGSSPPVKEEKVETALEKISESISGVITTIKNSVTSLFSPGHGIPQSGRMDCLNHTKGNSSSNSTDENLVEPSMLEKEPELLPHPVSLNGTGNSTDGESPSSTNSTMTVLPFNSTEVI